MLIYSKEPLNVMMKNILLLDDPFTNGYIYVNKETYDQALSLYITYNQDIGRVRQTISGKGMLNWAANKVISRVVNLCSENFCSPINMLAPYLAYTLPIGVEWPEDDEEIIRMAYGVLHQMSQFTNFYATSLMPAGAKADITIPKNIVMAYEESWKAQLETLDKCVVAIPIYIEKEVPVAQPTMVPVAEAHTIIPSSVTEEDGDEIGVGPRVAEDNVKVEEEVKQVEKVDHEDDSVKGSGEEVEEKPEEEESSAEEEADEEEEDDDLEARILAMMKDIEEAPAEDFEPPKTEDKKEEEKPVEKKKETVNYGESGSINLTEAEIAAGNRRLLEDYDI